MDKRSAFVLGLCLFAAGCTSDAGGAVTSTSSVGDPTSPAPATSAAPTFTSGSSSTVDGLPKLPAGIDVPVEPGTYVLDGLGTPIEVTVPAGWTAFDGVVLHAPDNAYLAFLTGPWDVYTDACQWVDAEAKTGPSVADLVTGLVAQVPTTNTPPRDMTVDGYSGTELTVASPPDLDFSTCYGGQYTLMINELRMQSPMLTPGESQTMWILDLNGERGIVTYGSLTSTSPATKAQLDAMLDSLKLG